MYYVALLVCMSMYTLFCNAMDLVKHHERGKKNLLSSLFSSISHYKYEETQAIIVQNPSLIDTFGSYKLSKSLCLEITPVHLAALEGNSVALEQLLTISKESVHAVTIEGYTPLHLASNERVAKVLLEHSAQPDQYNEHKYTPLYAALYGIPSYEHKPYFGIAYYLLQHGADVNKNCQFGTTALHKATSGNMSSQYAQFLLDNGADGDIKDNTGNTPFDHVIEQVVQRDVFQRSGYCYHWVQDHRNDPFELLKKDPQAFLRTNTIWNIIRDLYTAAQQQEEKRQPISKKLDAIIIKVGNDSKLYIFKRASFADLEMYFGKTAIDCLRNYFEGLLHEDQTVIIKNTKKPVVYVIGLIPMEIRYCIRQLSINEAI